MVNQKGEEFHKDNLVIKIANKAISIYIDKGEELLRQINNRYKKFIKKNISEYELKLNLTITHQQIERIPLKLIRSNYNKFTLEYNNLVAAIDFNNKICNASQPPHIALFDSLLRCLYSLILIRNYTVLIHAAGIIKDGKGFLFFGPTNSGKSTICQLSKNCVILSDEIIAVRIRKNNVTMYSTPFWGAMQTANVNKKIIIDKLYRIVKDDRNYIMRLSIKDALREILQNVISFTEDKEIAVELFNNCYELVKSIPCYELHFKKDISFWDKIT